MVKKSLALLLVLLLLLGQVYSKAEESFLNINFNTRIVDNAGVLSEAAKDTMLEKIKNIAQKYNFDTVLLTSYDVPTDGHEAFCDQFYENGDYGFDVQKSGMLLLMDLNNKWLYLYSIGEVIPYMSKENEQAILDILLPLVSQAKYDETMLQFLDNYILLLPPSPFEESGDLFAEEDDIFDSVFTGFASLFIVLLGGVLP